LAQNRLLATGIIGFIVSMLGCLTPVLVALLAALGVSGSMGWLDYLLLPAMAIFAGLAGYALVCRRRRDGLHESTVRDLAQKISSSTPSTRTTRGSASR